MVCFGDICLNCGQRVQKSVFECRVDKLHFEKLERNLVAEIDKSLDNLRLYRLAEPVQQYSREYGNFKATDFEEPLII